MNSNIKKMSFTIEFDEEVEEEYHPEYLREIFANFKAKRAKYKKTGEDKRAIDFYRIALDRDLEVIHQITNIYRVKKGGLGEKLCYSDNLIIRDKDGNDLVDPQFYRTYGTTKHPVIAYETDRNGRKKPIPSGIKIEHKIPFSAEEVDKIVDLCHEDFRNQINYVYCEINKDAKEPVNETHTYQIKNPEIFKTASNKDIKRMIQAKRTEIDSLSELNAPVLQANIVSPKSKG
jgi:hypothetical protein